MLSGDAAGGGAGGVGASVDLPTFDDVVAAHDRLRGRVLRTPVLSSPRFDERVGRRVLLKCENLQHAGAFKFRGASNALLELEAARRTAGADAGGGARVVATHSSGNHGAALARAASSSRAATSTSRSARSSRDGTPSRADQRCASMSQVSTTVSGLSERLSMPSSTSQRASSGWSDGP